jgi:hypothetical protein
MLVLATAQANDPAAGYARTFLTQMRDVLGTCVERGTKVVSNAGGLNPAGLAAESDALGPGAGGVGGGRRPARVARGDHPGAAGTAGVGQRLPGRLGIAAALEAGADVVVTGRVTDASLVLGPGARWHGWAADDWDALAEAVAAGRVIECAPQATGGNYSFLDEIADRRYPGSPIAEMAADGSSVITKHPGSGGLVSVGTVIAQLLHEIGPPAYLGPDVTAHLDTCRLEQAGEHRVTISGTRGSPPSETLKAPLNDAGGFRNTMTFWWRTPTRRRRPGAAGPGVRGAVGRQGRRRQHRGVGAAATPRTPGCAGSSPRSGRGSCWARRRRSWTSRCTRCRTCGR